MHREYCTLAVKTSWFKVKEEDQDRFARRIGRLAAPFYSRTKIIHNFYAG